MTTLRFLSHTLAASVLATAALAAERPATPPAVASALLSAADSLPAAATAPLTMDGLTKAAPIAKRIDSLSKTLNIDSIAVTRGVVKPVSNEASKTASQHAASIARLAAEYKGVPEVWAVFASAPLTPEEYLWMVLRMKTAVITMEIRKMVPAISFAADNEADVTFVRQHKDELIRLGMGWAWAKVEQTAGQPSVQAGWRPAPGTGDGAKQ